MLEQKFQLYKTWKCSLQCYCSDKKCEGILLVPCTNKNLMQLCQAANRKKTFLTSTVGNILDEGTDFCTQKQDFSNIWIIQLVPLAVLYHSKTSGLKTEAKHLRMP